MQRDPAWNRETKAWLQKANGDVRSADFQRTALPPFTGDMVFHAQQAAEKAFKAFLVWHGQTVRKTHSIEELGENCLRIDATLRSLVDQAAPLTEYAWRFRYPGDLDEPTLDEADRAVATARAVVEAIVARLPGEVHP